MADSTFLEFKKHYNRMSQLYMATSYAIAALDEKHESDRPKFDQWKVEHLERLTASIPETVRNDIDLTEVLEGFQSFLVLAPTANPIILSLALVSLCTELEIFISHLVHAILSVEPALLKSIASEKSLTGSELAECSSYQEALGRIHAKVAKEIVDSSAQKMFVRHLGSRLGLFSEADLFFTPDRSIRNVVSPDSKTTPTRRRDALAEITKAFQQRHATVHEGMLPVTDVDAFKSMHVIFSWAQVFLTVQAARKYPVRLDDVGWLAGWNGIYLWHCR
jgi:hypothetical protein